MPNFLERAATIPDPHGSYRLVMRARSQLQRTQSKAQLDIRNVESVFAAFEMAVLFNRLGDIDATELPELVPAMRALIVDTVQRSMEIKVHDRKIHAPSVYGEFGALVDALRKASNHVSIATFNYDVGIELGLCLSGLDIDYCLRDEENNDLRVVELMKLHGSLNWAVCRQNHRTNVVPVRIQRVISDAEATWELESSAPRRSGSVTKLDVASALTKETCHPCQKNFTTDPMIIPPTASKAGLHTELQTVWRRAAKRLSEADNIFVIGYSWPDGDHFFQQLYALGTVGETVLSRFWVFNPDDNVRSKFRKRLLGQQAQECFGPAEPATFADAVQKVAGEFGLGDIRQPRRS